MQLFPQLQFENILPKPRKSHSVKKTKIKKLKHFIINLETKLFKTYILNILFS